MTRSVARFLCDSWASSFLRHGIILNFRPCAARGHPELSPVSRDDLPRAGCLIFIAARCYASAAYVVMWCLSVCVCVCLSVTFVDPFKTNKCVFKIFSPSCSQTILVFPHQTAWQYSDGNRLTGASNAGGVGINRDSEPISSLTARVNAATGQVL